MHPVRIGRIARTLRRRRGDRQVDVAKRAGVSQQVVSLVETGQLGRVSVQRLDRVLRALEAELELNVRWRGGELDRVLDEGHAHLVQAIAAQLEAKGWAVALEVTYAIGSDRGSIDVLAFNARSGALLVVEVKTDVTSAEGTLRKHDEKVRIAASVARARLGWEARSVSRLLVLPDASTARRRVARHDGLFNRAYPLRASQLRAWLRGPAAAISGLLFLSATKGVGDRRALTSRRRVRRSPIERPAHGNLPASVSAEEQLPTVLSNTALPGR